MANKDLKVNVNDDVEAYNGHADRDDFKDYNQDKVVKDYYEEQVDVNDAEYMDAHNAEEFTIAMTPQTDDPNTPALTFRSVFLGIVWGIVLACANTLFSFRLAQLLSYPMGIFMASTLPRGFLNPGPFTVKEHVLIFIIAGAAGGLPYGVDNVVGQYASTYMADPAVNIWNSLAWVAVSQMAGYGIAGLARRFLVKPTAMLWPTALPSVALFTALNGTKTIADESSKYKISRYKFFWLAFLVMFVWSWIPGFLAKATSAISILCLITTNKSAKFLGSATAGVGLLSFSFDWSIIYVYAPIATPWWATLNWFFGTVLWQWIVVPAVFYTNTFNRPPLYSDVTFSDGTPIEPMNDNSIFNSTGFPIKIGRPNLAIPKRSDYSAMLTQDFQLDEQKYAIQGPFFLTDFFAIGYFTSFLNIAAVVSHVGLWYGKDIVKQAKAAFRQTRTDDGLTDTHNQLMKAYADIPEWLYLAYLFVFSVLAVFVCQFTPFYMPWWATIFAIGLGVFMTIPIGLIQAVSGTQIGLNVLTEFVIGLILPGQTVAVMTFKSLGYNTLIQALALVSDLKLGHYMHIAPISMVIAQMIGTVIGIIFNTGTAFFVIDALKNPHIFVDESWKGTYYNIFVNAGGIWGAIGPQRFFGIGSPYASLLLGFPIGLLLPFLPWVMNKLYPHPNWHLGPGGAQSFMLPALIVGFIFQFYIFRFKKEWFDKYNYVLSCALDAGTAIGILVFTVFVNIFPDFSIISPISPAGSADYYCQDGTYTE